MATHEERWMEYKHMDKKELLGICENLNIDIIWKAWKDDIIRTVIDVQDKLARYDSTMFRHETVTVTQFISGYESLKPLPTYNTRSNRAEQYGLILKNDLITRCKELKVNLGWKSSRDDLIEAILNAEDKAGANISKVSITSTAPPMNSAEKQPMARQNKYYDGKTRNYIKRRCRLFRISKSRRRPTSELTRKIIDVEGKTSGLLQIKHVYVPKGPGAPPMPYVDQITTTIGTLPTTQISRQEASFGPEPHQHINHAGVTVVYPSQAHNLTGGSGLPIATKQLNPVYERYRDQTQLPMELWYEPLSRTPRMIEAAAKYNEMTLSQLQDIIRARSYTRDIEQDCSTKLECIDTLIDDDRKNNLLPAAPARVYRLQPGEVMESNPDPGIFIRRPTVMQHEVLRILQTSLQEAESFQVSREAFYEQFSQEEMEMEVHARKIIYAPTVRRQLVRSDMRMFERVRRIRAGLPARGDEVPEGEGVEGVVAATVEAI
ncbi:hypothetical protein V493_08221 [Pseudogymnoascus sp. VKM F-4281 (FW-2241)]|nr:hypothetical protein V493_08221 [Pseudogymnoascus sp. VKM F-4281 (FW-2241)]